MSMRKPCLLVLDIGLDAIGIAGQDRSFCGPDGTSRACLVLQAHEVVLTAEGPAESARTQLVELTGVRANFVETLDEKEIVLIDHGTFVYTASTSTPRASLHLDAVPLVVFSPPPAAIQGLP